jgi:hypothetical protein
VKFNSGKKQFNYDSQNETGRFIDQKADKEPFKGMRKEK